MSRTIAIAGATGYAGGELIRLLSGHPAITSGDLAITTLTGSSSVGSRGAEVLPQAPQLCDHVIAETTPEVLSGHDIVFLCLPHGHSAEIAQALTPETLIIDCGADFRLKDADAWQAYYGSEHPGSWPYGIPEMPGHREQIRNATRISIPGCFPTGATLALLPAVLAGLIDKEISITSITGVSGAGKKANVGLLGAETMGSLRAYNTAGRHRHTPEIVQNLSEYFTTADGEHTQATVSFTPVLAPLPRGILTTAHARLRGGVSATDVRAVYESFCAPEPFVYLRPEGSQPETQHVVGTNCCQLQAEVDSVTGELLVTSAIDNLTKGTAGGAVQCMNLSLGFEETAGLPRIALAP